MRRRPLRHLLRSLTSRRLALAFCLLLTFALLTGQQGRRPGAQQDETEGTCAWRATRCGSGAQGRPTTQAERLPSEDLDCSARIHPTAPLLSGFCECAGGRAVKPLWSRGCGRTALIWHLTRWLSRSFSCRELCNAGGRAECTEASQRSWSCGAGSLKEEIGALLPKPAQILAGYFSENHTSAHDAALWLAIDAAFLQAKGHDVQSPPGVRGFGARAGNDFVVAGLRMQGLAVATARAQWMQFLSTAPAYPDAAFHGRGIVLGGGGLPFLPAAFASLRALRRTGCTLPVEMWFGSGEAPREGDGLWDALAAHGASVRSLDELPRSTFVSGYTLKGVALLFTQFETALWLDADNLALRDPSSLFETPGFVEHGMMLWPDFWTASWAPDAALILAGPGGEGRWEAAMKGTCESGSIVVDKRRAWRPLLLAYFLQLQGALYFRLLSSYMGSGDKETWPAAAAALGFPVSWASAAPTGAVGLASPRHADVLLANAMLQHDPVDGEPLFLHANYFKLSPANVPLCAADILPGSRRWLLVTPRGWDAERSSAHIAGLRPVTEVLHTDVESAAWSDVATLYCEPWWPACEEERRLRWGEAAAVPAACGPGGEAPAFAGLVLAEHVGGRYREIWEWHWARGIRRSRVGV